MFRECNRGLAIYRSRWIPIAGYWSVFLNLLPAKIDSFR